MRGDAHRSTSRTRPNRSVSSWHEHQPNHHRHLVERRNVYTFLVNKSSTKTDIRAAVEELWGVKVVSVKTMNRVGKPRRHKMRETTAADTKKAIVVLSSDDRIAFF